MIREIWHGAELWQLPIIALILFFVAAVGIGFYVLQRGAARRYAAMANIPFSEEFVVSQEEES